MKRFYLGFCLIALLLSGFTGCNDNENGNNDPGIPIGQKNRARVVISGDIPDTIRSRARPDFDDTVTITYTDQNGNTIRDTAFGGFNMFWGDLSGSTVRLWVSDITSTIRADTGIYQPYGGIADSSVRQYFRITINPNGGLPDPELTIPQKDTAGALRIDVNNDQQLKGSLSNVKVTARDADTTCRVNGTFRINR